MERLDPEGPAGDQVPVEGLEVPQVENESMAFRNGTLVQGTLLQNREESVGLGSRVLQSVGQSLT